RAALRSARRPTTDLRSGAEAQSGARRGTGSSSAVAEEGGSVVPPDDSNLLGAEDEELPVPLRPRRKSRAEWRRARYGPTSTVTSAERPARRARSAGAPAQTMRTGTR